MLTIGSHLITSICIVCVFAYLQGYFVCLVLYIVYVFNISCMRFLYSCVCTVQQALFDDFQISLLLECTCVFAGRPCGNMRVCVSARSSCHVALCVGVSVHSRPLTHMPPLRGPRWLRWVSTHGVHGLDHSVCCGDIGRLLLQAVGLFVDRLYLDVWFTEGDTPSTWKKSTTSGHNLSQRQESYWFIYFFKQSKKAKQNNNILFWFILCLSDLSGPLSALFIFSPLILVH